MKKFLTLSLLGLIGIEALFLCLFLKGHLGWVPVREAAGEILFPAMRPGGILEGAPASPLQKKGKTFLFFPFTRKEDLRKWQEKIVQGESRYWIDFEQNQGFVESEAKGTASARYYRVSYDVKTYPYLAWWWKVGRFPNKEKSSNPQQMDDYPNRFYVIFASRFFKNFSCVEYLWDDRLPEGTTQISPLTPQIRQLVLRTGAKDGKWCYEERNIMEDFRKLFGDAPKNKVRAIAFMTDADNTQSIARGFFDDVWLGALKKGGSGS